MISREELVCLWFDYNDYSFSKLERVLVCFDRIDSLFDKIIYVDANKDLRIERLIKRNNLTKEEALLRINSQQNNKSKADFIIENNSDLNKLEAKVNSILHELICK